MRYILNDVWIKLYDDLDSLGNNVVMVVVRVAGGKVWVWLKYNRQVSIVVEVL